MSDVLPDPEAMFAALSLTASTDITQDERLRRIAWLERVKAAASAWQARETHALDAAVRASASTQREQVELQRRVNAEVALARRESPAAGSRLVGVARALVEEMPQTLAKLESGETNEWRATLMVRETAVLTREDRIAVDAEVGPRIGSMGNRQVSAAARKVGYRLDPGSVLRRVRGAESDRHVSLRPAPDTMTFLTGFLPVAHGVAVHTALRRQADSLRGQGDARSIGQLMADTLVARVTGREQAAGTPVELRIVTTVETALGHQTAQSDRTPDSRSADQPGLIPGYGPIPAFLVRRLTREADRAWVRRLFTQPQTGQLIAMESHRRLFDGRLRDFIITRDQTCRTSWCDAPIRHIDHVVPAGEGGPTSAENAQGLCERCNYAKQAPDLPATPTEPRRPSADKPSADKPSAATAHLLSLTSQTGPPPRLSDRPRHEVDVFFPDVVVDYSAA